MCVGGAVRPPDLLLNPVILHHTQAMHYKRIPGGGGGTEGQEVGAAACNVPWLSLTGRELHRTFDS